MAPIAELSIVARGIGNHVPFLARILVVLPVLSTIAIAARLVVRFRNRQFKHDDAWIILSGLLSWAFFVVYFDSMKLLNGRQVHELDGLEIQNLIKHYLGQELVYFLCLTAVKLSVLIFYLRAVGTTTVSRRMIYFMIAFIVAYTIARFFATIFQCRPVRYFWDHEVGGTCVNYHQLILTLTVINTITDLALLVFPMPIVWHLRIPRKQKVSICIVFCVGGLACGAAVARIYIIQQIFTSEIGSLLSNDAAPKLVLCGAIEANVGLISACLPTLRSSFRKLTTFFKSHRNSVSSQRFSIETITTRKASVGLINVPTIEEGVIAEKDKAQILVARDSVHSETVRFDPNADKEYC